jgi:hypothetical protein
MQRKVVLLFVLIVFGLVDAWRTKMNPKASDAPVLADLRTANSLEDSLALTTDISGFYRRGEASKRD